MRHDDPPIPAERPVPILSAHTLSAHTDDHVALAWLESPRLGITFLTGSRVRPPSGAGTRRTGIRTFRPVVRGRWGLSGPCPPMTGSSSRAPPVPMGSSITAYPWD